MKDFEYYKRLHYKMIFYYDSEDKTHYVEFPELPGCIADGKTPAKALSCALRAKDEWIEAALEAGWEIPEPAVPLQTSGRQTVRLPKSVHKKLIDRAHEESVSLNQLILTYIAEGLERVAAKEYFDKVIEKKKEQFTRLEDEFEPLKPTYLERAPVWITDSQQHIGWLINMGSQFRPANLKVTPEIEQQSKVISNIARGENERPN